jgi:hypothetical protein
VQEITVLLEGAPVKECILVTVRMRDGAGVWHPLCSRQSVTLPLPVGI